MAIIFPVRISRLLSCAEPLARFDPGAPLLAEDSSAYWTLVTSGPDRLPAPGSGVALWRHAEVEALLKHPTAPAKCPARALHAFPPGPFRDHNAATMTFMDPPGHGPVRRSFARAFAPSVLATLTPFVEAASARLLRGLCGETDLVSAYAERLPVLVIARILGVDPAAERQLRAAAATVVAGLEPAAPPTAHRAADAAVTLLARLVAPQMEKPAADSLFAWLADTPAADLPSAAHRLHNAIFLLNAGHETTSRLIAALAVALMDDPALAIRAEGEKGAAALVEEVLRLDPPLHFVPRFLAEPWRDLAEGSLVFLLLAAANRDPCVFPDPARLQPARAGATRHLSFAAGRHLCLGASLARIEGRVACRHLARLVPRLRRVPGAVRTAGRMFQGWERLPVSVE